VISYLSPCLGFSDDQLSYIFLSYLMCCVGDSTVGDHTSPYLQEEILSLKDLHDAIDQGQQSEPVVQSEPEPAVATHPHPVEERKPAEKKVVKPKWLKM